MDSLSVFRAENKLFFGIKAVFATALSVIMAFLLFSVVLSFTTSKSENSPASHVESGKVAVSRYSHYTNNEYTIDDIVNAYNTADYNNPVSEKMRLFYLDMANYYQIMYYTDIGDSENVQQLAYDGYIGWRYDAEYDYAQYKLYLYYAENLVWDFSFAEVSLDNIMITTHTGANTHAVSIYRFSLFAPLFFAIIMGAVAALVFMVGRGKTEKHIAAADTSRNATFLGRLLFCLVWDAVLFILFCLAGLAVGAFDFSARLFIVGGAGITPAWSVFLLKMTYSFACGILLTSLAAFGATIGKKGVFAAMLPISVILYFAVIYFRNAANYFLTGITLAELAAIPLFGQALTPSVTGVTSYITFTLELAAAAAIIIVALRRNKKISIL